MKEFVICKACGYVAEKTSLGKSCPACGVPATAFIPYEEKMSAKRRFILSLDIHPVFAHFPQAFTFTLLILIAAIPFTSGILQVKLSAALDILVVLLPVTVLLTLVAGLLDGKIRFRRLSTPFLRMKMALGILFLVSASILAILNYANTEGIPSIAFIRILLAIVAFSCSAMLGVIGAKLVTVKIPG